MLEKRSTSELYPQLESMSFMPGVEVYAVPLLPSPKATVFFFYKAEIKMEALHGEIVGNKEMQI